MAKLLVQHDTDPGIVVILEQAASTVTEGLMVWRGKCTQCGCPIRGVYADSAIPRAKDHVDTHEDAR